MAQLYRTVVGGLGWMPGAFWRATLAEVFLAVEGHNDANRTGSIPPSEEELAWLAAEYPDEV